MTSTLVARIRYCGLVPLTQVRKPMKWLGPGVVLMKHFLSSREQQAIAELVLADGSADFSCYLHQLIRALRFRISHFDLHPAPWCRAVFPASLRTEAGKCWRRRCGAARASLHVLLRSELGPACSEILRAARRKCIADPGRSARRSSSGPPVGLPTTSQLPALPS